MRVSTAFNRILQVPGAWVDSVEFMEAGIVVGLRRRQRQHVCPCGRCSRARYDLSRRRWRHLDMGRCALWLEADIARIDCRRCSRVRTEQVPWARPGARLDLEDVIAWLAQRTDKTSICRLLRVSWQTVHRTVTLLVADHLDDNRLDNLYRLGIDEISYKRGHHYLTVIANHDNGRVVGVAKGRNHRVLQGFFDALGPDRCAQVEAISMDLAKVWQAPCAANIPQAAVCFDPFHVIRVRHEVPCLRGRVRDPLVLPRSGGHSDVALVSLTRVSGMVMPRSRRVRLAQEVSDRVPPSCSRSGGRGP